jgi:hypothetical protein
VPAGMIIKQNPTPETMLDPNSYIYLTTSIGPPGESIAPQRTEPQPEGSPAPSSAGAPSGRGESGGPSLLANGNRSGIYNVLDRLLRRYHPKNGFTSSADAQYTN